MQIVRRISDLRDVLATAKCPAFVPTMGNLHKGHLSLIQQARTYGDCTVASIFVNRLQFLPHEDYERYPRTFEADSAALISAGCDVLFSPGEEDLYPEPQRFKVMADPLLGSKLEGVFRPGFFDGVCTVVMKLFMSVFAGKLEGTAVFGKKDYQQWRIIQAMTSQFALPIKIIAGETERDRDGLALSSRNRYLTGLQREQACGLYRQLSEFAQRYLVDDSKPRDPAWVAAAEKRATLKLVDEGWTVDYFRLCRREDLEPASAGDLRVLLAAATIGGTRLIDSLEF